MTEHDIEPHIVEEDGKWWIFGRLSGVCMGGSFETLEEAEITLDRTDFEALAAFHALVEDRER